MDFPFNKDTDKYLRHLWNRACYIFLARIFTKVMEARPYQVFQMGNVDGEPVMDWVRAVEGTPNTD
jgi:hypothetical protein